MEEDFTSKIRSKQSEQKRLSDEQNRQDSLIGAIKSTGDDTKTEVTTAIHDLMLATLVGKDPRLVDVASNLADLLTGIKTAADELGNLDIGRMPAAYDELITLLQSIPAAIASQDRTDEVIGELQELQTTLRSKSTSPNVTVKAPDLDLKPLEKFLGRIETALDKKPETKFDTSELKKAVEDVEKAVKQLINKPIPIPVTPSPFKNASGDGVQAVVNDNGSLISGGRLVTEDFDYISAAYPNSTTETYTYKDGGAAGTTVATVTVVYTTSTKDVLTSVTRT